MGLIDDVTPALVTETDARAAVQDAEVRFSDGTLARYSAVTFLPDGRLRADVEAHVGVDGKEHTVTRTIYFAAGAWHSVQEPPRGVIIADVELPSRYGGRKYSEVIAAGCYETQILATVVEWTEKRWKTNAILPNPPSKITDQTELLSTKFEYFEKSAHNPADYELAQTVRYRWIVPETPAQSVPRPSTRDLPPAQSTDDATAEP